MIECGKKIYLCDPANNVIAELNGLVTDSVSYSNHTKDYRTLTCDIDHYIIIDGEQITSSGYDKLGVNMQLLLDGIGYFQMQQPEENNDGSREYKSITAYSCEKEFEDKDILSFQVNTGEDGSLERLNEDNLDDLGFAKEYVTFYRSNDSGTTDYSLIHYFLEQMPGWSVRDVDIDRSLWDKKATFDEENTNLYALLTSVVAPKFECVITFDILNRRIGAIAKEHLDSSSTEVTNPDGTTSIVTYNNDFDTSIFIGFRNLANSVQVTVDEDSIFTQFTCSGGDGDLTFEDVNYGQKKIIDLSYFMVEPYMRQETVEKLKTWQTWCDENRDKYIDLSRQWATLNDKNTELNDRVPSDMDYWKQWSEMNSDLLTQNLKYYQTLLESLQQSVDQRSDSEKFTGSGDNKTYNPVTKSDGSVDHDYYLDLFKQEVANYGGYYTYKEIITYVLPNIQIAIGNKGKVESEQKDYVKTYETDWSLYGITELQNKKTTYEDVIATRGEYALPFKDATTDKGEAEYTKKYSEYWDAKNNLETLEPVLEKLLKEQEELQNQIDNVLSKRRDYEKQYLFVTTDSSGNKIYNWDLTESEYILITTLIHNTDYTNSNIIVTSVDDTLARIEHEKELLDDSISKLSEVSQPQYKFSVDLDNLLRIPEFRHWVPDLQLYKFIRLGIRDDYSVKLRIIGITYNPCEITPELTLEFSNMITSSSGRSDLTDILSSENNRGSKNSISLGASTNYDVDFATTLLQTMMKTGLFRNSISNIVGDLNITGEAIIDTAKIKNLFAEYIEAGNIKVGYIAGDKAEFKEFYSKYGVIDELVSQIISASTIYADQIRSKDGKTFIDLVNSSLNIQKIAADEIITNTITSISSTAAKEVVDYSYIHDAIVGKMTAGELLTGDIVVTDKMRILSDASGTSGLVVNGSTMQFIGTDGTVGIQIGYGTNDKPSLIIRDDNGTALFTSSGINAGVQASAIADGLIVNNMISNNSISKDKINFPIIEPNAQGGVDITQIYDGKGNKWGVESTQFAKDIIKFKEDSEKHQQQTDSSIGTLNNQIESIENSITGIETVVDKENKTIKDVVWENVYLYKPKLDASGKIQYDSDGNIITEKDAYNIIQRNNETIRTLSELTTTIYDKDLNGKTSRITTAMQTAEKFYWLVKNGSSQSSLTLTDSMLNAIVSQFKVTGSDGASTIIEGGKLKTNSITANDLDVNSIFAQDITATGTITGVALKSTTGSFQVYADGTVKMIGKNSKFEFNTVTGELEIDATKLSLNSKLVDLSGYVTFSGLAGNGTTTIDGSNIKTGTISADRLDINSIFAKDITATGTITGVTLNGATGSFSGTITSGAGKIGGWNIGTGSISYSTDTHTVTMAPMTNANGDFLVVYDKANNTWPFFVRADGFHAYKGTIGGFTINNSSIYKGTDSIDSGTEGVYVGTDGISNVGSYGSAKIRDGHIELDSLILNYGNGVSIYDFESNPNSINHFQINKNGYAYFREIDSYYNWLGSQKCGWYDNEGTGKLYCRYKENASGEYKYTNIAYIMNALSGKAASGHTHNGLFVNTSVGFSGSKGALYRTWKDKAAHDIIVSPDDGLSTYVGWAGSSTYKTFVNLRGQSIKCNGSTSWSSDRNLKHEIHDINDPYERFFYLLRPVSYQYDLGGSGRHHIGYIAQEVEQSLYESGLTTQDFAGFVSFELNRETETDENGYEQDIENSESNYLLNKGFHQQYNLAYIEFIALNTHMIQKQYKYIQELQNDYNFIKQQLQNALAQIEAMQQTINRLGMAI